VSRISEKSILNCGKDAALSNSRTSRFRAYPEHAGVSPCACVWVMFSIIAFRSRPTSASMKPVRPVGCHTHIHRFADRLPLGMPPTRSAAARVLRADARDCHPIYLIASPPSLHFLGSASSSAWRAARSSVGISYVARCFPGSARLAMGIFGAGKERRVTNRRPVVLVLWLAGGAAGPCRRQLALAICSDLHLYRPPPTM